MKLTLQEQLAIAQGERDAMAREVIRLRAIIERYEAAMRSALIDPKKVREGR